MKPIHGEHIKAARQLRGLSRRELAEQLEMTWWALVDLERGSTRIGEGSRWDASLSLDDDALVFRLCRVLCCPLAFFQRDVEPPLPVGSEAFHWEWTDDEIDAL